MINGLARLLTLYVVARMLHWRWKLWRYHRAPVTVIKGRNVGPSGWHYSGRAIDLTTDDVDWSSLQVGFDFDNPKWPITWGVASAPPPPRPPARRWNHTLGCWEPVS